MCRANPKLTIRLFSGLYKKMLQKAETLQELPDAPSRKNIIWNEDVLEAFSKEDREKIREILDQKKMIPQEIINYQDYKEMYRGEQC